MADRTRPDAEEIAKALAETHGLDPRSSLALRARFELALAEPISERESGPALLARLAQRLRVGETRFYRDHEQLEALATTLFPRAIEAGKLRVLSAGCSTGEEAWTLAAMLEDARLGAGAGAGERPFAWDVLGIDALGESVSRARAATYPASAIAAMPRRLGRHFVESAGEVRPSPALLARTRFGEGDLLAMPLGGPFGLVLCRNVLIYLEEPAALRLIERLAAQLTRDGVLVVARAEVPLARRAKLPIVELGGRLVAFSRADAPPASRAAPSSRVAPSSRASAPSSRARAAPSAPPVRPTKDEEAPPSRVCLEIDERSLASIVARGQAMLAAGAPVIELRIAARLSHAQLHEIEAPLRRLAAAAKALGSRCIAADDATARAFAAAHVPIGRS
jgi:chemotaxis methyl-accepting protein methylase